MNLLMGSSYDTHSHLVQGSSFGGKGFGQGAHGGAGHNSFGASGHEAGFGKNHTSYAGSLAQQNYMRHHQMTGTTPGTKNSVLSSMTLSKNDSKPAFFSSFSDPATHDAHKSGIVASYYENTESKKRPKLVRQKSVFGDAPPRAPLSRSVSVGGAGSNIPLNDARARPPLRSSMSVVSPSSRYRTLSERSSSFHRSFDSDLFSPIKDLPPRMKKSEKRRNSKDSDKSVKPKKSGKALLAGIVAKLVRSKSVSGRSIPEPPSVQHSQSAPASNNKSPEDNKNGGELERTSTLRRDSARSEPGRSESDRDSLDRNNTLRSDSEQKELPNSDSPVSKWANSDSQPPASIPLEDEQAKLILSLMNPVRPKSPEKATATVERPTFRYGRPNDAEEKPTAKTTVHVHKEPDTQMQPIKRRLQTTTVIHPSNGISTTVIRPVGLGEKMNSPSEVRKLAQPQIAALRQQEPDSSFNPMRWSPRPKSGSESDISEVFYDCDGEEEEEEMDLQSLGIDNKYDGERGQGSKVSPRDYFKNYTPHEDKSHLEKSGPVKAETVIAERKPKVESSPSKPVIVGVPSMSVKDLVDKMNKCSSKTDNDGFQPVALMAPDIVVPSQHKPVSNPIIYHMEEEEEDDDEDDTEEDDSEEDEDKEILLQPMPRLSTGRPIFVKNISDIPEFDEEEEGSLEKLNLSHCIDNGREPSHNGTCTADSSESGYATSARHNSPRQSEIKSAYFINQLKSYEDLEDEVLNGSGTDTDHDNDDVHFLKGSLVSMPDCVSGSDTDEHSDENDSVSKLEVMKILESPTEVRERIEPLMAKKQRGSPINLTGSVNRRKPKPGSETEVLVSKDRDYSPGSKGKDQWSARFEDECLITNDRPSESSPPQSPRTMKKSSTSSLKHVFERPLMSFRRQRSDSHTDDKLTTSLDCAMHIVNLILFIVSVAVLALSIWLLLRDFNVNQITEIFDNNILMCIVYIAIGGAGVAALTTMCMCCSIKQDRAGLGFYTFVLILVMIAFTTASILSGIFGDKLDGVELKFKFKDKLLSEYGIINDTFSNQYFTDSWDSMQRTFSCCGAYGNVNDTSSWALYRRSEWFRLLPTEKLVHVPQSCCVPHSDFQICQKGKPRLFGPPLYGPPMREHFNEVNPHLNTDGCYKKVSDYLIWLASIITIVTGSIAGLFFLVAILTWFLCSKVKKREIDEYSYSEYGEDEEEEEDEDEVFDDQYEMDDMGKQNPHLIDRRDRWNHSETETNHFFTPILEEEEENGESDDDKSARRRKDSNV